MKKLILSGLIVILTMLRLFASRPGSTGANFLKINLNPKQSAMGSCGIGLTDGVGSFFTNPAGISDINYQNLSFFYNIWFEDINAQYLSYILPTPIGSFGTNINYFGYGKIKGYDANGKKTSNVNANDLCINLSYGREIPSFRIKGYEVLKGVKAGISLKYIQEMLDNQSASTVVTDIGMKVDLGKSNNRLKGISLGCSIRNIGRGLTFDEEKAPLPQIFGMGIGIKRELLGEELNLGIDMNIPNDNTMYVASGLEYWVKDIIALRVGYNSREDVSNGISLGIGLKADIFSINYSFVGYGDLGYTHRIGMEIKIGANIKEILIRKAFQKGISYMREKRYAEAILEFNKVLKYDSTNIEALELIKQANERLSR